MLKTPERGSMQLAPPPPPRTTAGIWIWVYVGELAIFNKEIKEIYNTKQKEIKGIIIRMNKYINK